MPKSLGDLTKVTSRLSLLCILLIPTLKSNADSLSIDAPFAQDSQKAYELLIQSGRKLLDDLEIDQMTGYEEANAVALARKHFLRDVLLTLIRFRADISIADEKKVVAAFESAVITDRYDSALRNFGEQKPYFDNYLKVQVASFITNSREITRGALVYKDSDELFLYTLTKELSSETDTNIAETKITYNDCAIQGNSFCIYGLARIAFLYGGKDEFLQGVELLEKSSKMENPIAQLLLGKFLFTNSPILHMDSARSVSLWKQSSRYLIEAAFSLAEAYSSGYGVAKNHAAARSIVTKILADILSGKLVTSSSVSWVTSELMVSSSSLGFLSEELDDRQRNDGWLTGTKLLHKSALHNPRAMLDIFEADEAPISRNNSLSHFIFLAQKTARKHPRVWTRLRAYPQTLTTIADAYVNGTWDYDIGLFVSYAKRAYELGNPVAGFLLSQQLLDETSDFYDPRTALEILVQIEKYGDPEVSLLYESQILLGDIHKNGMLSTKDLGKALIFFQKALEGKDQLSEQSVRHAALGIIEIETEIIAPKSEKQPALNKYLNIACATFQESYALDVIESPIWKLLGKNKNLSESCFKKIVKTLVDAQYFVDAADLLNQGIPNYVSANPQEAFKYMQTATDSDAYAFRRIEAMSWLSLYYDKGIGTTRNPELALHWLNKAVSFKNTTALNNLGWAYENGDLGLEIDLDRAFSLYEEAYDLDKNFFLPMTNLGRFYELGLSVNTDYMSARSFYEQAYKIGDIEAGNLLAQLMVKGLGGKKDIEGAVLILREISLGSIAYEISVSAEDHDIEVDKSTLLLADILPNNEYSDTINFGNYHALVIGNSEYDYLHSLKTAKNDAESVAKILESDYDFKVQRLFDANRLAIRKALNKYRNTLTKNDNFLLYYAGHGVLDEETDEGYWQPIDAEKIDNSQWIPTTTINKTLKAFKSDNVLVVADSCYAGTIFRGVKVTNDYEVDKQIGVSKSNDELLKRLIGQRTRVAMTSGGLEEVPDSLGASPHSVFAKFFMQTLRDNSSIITASEVFQRVRNKVIPVTAEYGIEQTPEYRPLPPSSGHDGGDFVFKKMQNL